MKAEPGVVVIEPGPGSCGTISFGGPASLQYRFGIGPAPEGHAAVVVTNQGASIVGRPDLERWVPDGWTSASTDDDPPALRRLPGLEPRFLSGPLGGAEVTVLLPEPGRTQADAAASGAPSGHAGDERSAPPFDRSWSMQQREMRPFLAGHAASGPGERPQMKLSGHGNVVKAIREQVERGRAVTEWRAESAFPLALVLRISGVVVLVSSGLDPQDWLALQARHRGALREVDVAVVRVSPVPLRHLPSYLRSVLPRASAVVDAGQPGRQWPVADPAPLEVVAGPRDGSYVVEARTR